jgi:N,N'-diacetyllegionaminate synthase
MRYFDEEGVFVIAEIGGNHEGDIEKAKTLLELAAESGADAAKFQVYRADKLVSKVEDPARNRHYQQFELSIDQYVELAGIASDLGILFMASIWDREATTQLAPLIRIHKIGSGDFTAYEMVEAAVSTGKPIIQSCGLATIEEVEDYVGYVRSLDPSYITERKLCLMQCTVMYPIPEREANLNAMLLIRERTRLPVGYSDHTVGTYASEIAVAMGAEVVEMHFTDQRGGREFRDHQLSVTRDEMRRFIDRVKTIKELQGAYEKRPTPSESEENHVLSFRRAVYPAVDLPAGSVLTRDNTISLRPNVGIDGRDYFRVLGKRLRVDKRAYEHLEWSELEQAEE